MKLSVRSSGFSAGRRENAEFFTVPEAGCTGERSVHASRNWAWARPVEGLLVHTDTVFRRARDSLLSALLGDKADGEATAELSLGTRIVVTLLALGIATLI